MQGLIIAIIIITFLYNVYKNFKKETEKATVRAKEAEELQKATQGATVAENSRGNGYGKVVEQPSFQSTYTQPPATEFKPTPTFENNKQDYFKEKAKPKNVKETKVVKKTPGLDYYNPEVPVAEVVENRRIHQPHKHSFKFPKNEKHPLADFDIRKALIYDAILRRPEY